MCLLRKHPKPMLKQAKFLFFIIRATADTLIYLVLKQAKFLFFIIRATADTLIYLASTSVFTSFTWYGLQRSQSHKLLLYIK